MLYVLAGNDHLGTCSYQVANRMYQLPGGFMHINRSFAVGSLLFGLTSFGCTAEPEADRNIDTAAVGKRSIPAELVQQLRNQYPVLGKATAPEPQPTSSAAPEDVPDRLRRVLPQKVFERVTGEATFYADHFEGRRTASGIPFRQNQMVAAHRAYPFGTLLRVTNVENDRSVSVRVVDRGPFGSAAKARGTILDLSRRAATQLGYTDAGRTTVQVEVLEWGKGIPVA